MNAEGIRIQPLREWGRVDDLTLGHEQVAALLDSTAFRIEPGRRRDTWTVHAQRHVGVARFGDLELRVTPKVPARRLLSLMLQSSASITWDESVDPEYANDDDVVTLLAAGFVAAAERLVRRGLIQGYRSITDALPTVRGRILAGAQVARRSGLPLPVELEFDEFTFDIVENQLVAGAAAALSTIDHLPFGLRARLRRLRRELDGIHPWPGRTRWPEIAFTRLNDHYRPILGMAELVLDRHALDERRPSGSGHRAPGFLIDMDKVFEDVVSGGMHTRAPVGLRITRQHTDPLDRQGTRTIRLDIGVLHQGRMVALADVKYRDPTRRDIRGDVYQVLAYAHRYRLRQVHLVYAAPPDHPVLHVGDTEVCLHHLDLDSSADELNRQLDRLTLAVTAPAVSGLGP